MTQTESCNFKIKGKLKDYCPTLVKLQFPNPFCYTDENQNPACEVLKRSNKEIDVFSQHTNYLLQSSALSNEEKVDYLLTQRKILIVEDNEDDTHVLRKTLHHYNDLFIVATNGLEALKVITEISEIALILLDIALPVMDGIQFLNEKQKFDNSISAIPVVIVTELDWVTAKKAIEFGANGHISKPFTKDGILNEISRVLIENPST